MFHTTGAFHANLSSCPVHDVISDGYVFDPLGYVGQGTADVVKNLRGDCLDFAGIVALQSVVLGHCISENIDTHRLACDMDQDQDGFVVFREAKAWFQDLIHVYHGGQTSGAFEFIEALKPHAREMRSEMTDQQFEQMKDIDKGCYQRFLDEADALHFEDDDKISRVDCNT